MLMADSTFQQPSAELLPHVYSTSSVAQGNVISQLGSKYMLPIGTSRNTYEVGFFLVWNLVDSD